MGNHRWNPYVFLSGDEVEMMFTNHFNGDRNVLFIMGKGFDVRMNITIRRLLAVTPDINITCLLVNFDEGADSTSHKYKPYVENNMKELQETLEASRIKHVSIDLWKYDVRKKRRVGDRNAAKIVDGLSLSHYTDIIVDISALPRGVYFSLVGKLLTLIDNLDEGSHIPNLMVAVAENSELDRNIHEDRIDEDLNFLHGFSGAIDLTASENDEPLIWLPILGEDKLLHIRKAYAHLKPGEICPILPFPCHNPRRPDALTTEYHGLLFDELLIEPQNIMYVPEQNPFETYKILSNAIENYNESLKVLKGCKAVLTTFSSKLLSIGTLLAAYELKTKSIGVGVLNVDSAGYEITAEADLQRLKSESIVFVSWLTGEPYSN